MRKARGRVIEIEMTQGIIPAVRIACPNGLAPAPGQYLLAWDPSEIGAPLAVSLFLADTGSEDFLAIPGSPVTWAPGTTLMLRGPFGHGFRMPPGLRHLALVSLDQSPVRLMPLGSQALHGGADVALFTDAAPLSVPSAIEIYPLLTLPDALPWADFLALELPVSKLPGWRSRLGLTPGVTVNCPGQALVLTPMPCGGVASCGACAVPVRGGLRLACEDGPVFDLGELII